MTLRTLSEAAALTGLSVDALRKRIRRGRLEAVNGNDGLVRVRLTEADLAGLGAVQPSPDGAPSPPDERDRTIAALEQTIADLRLAGDRDREALARERDRADRAEAAAAEERTRAAAAIETARQDVAAARQEAAQARQDAAGHHERAGAAAVRAAAAEGREQELRMALDLARRPWWRRLIGS